MKTIIISESQAKMLKKVLESKNKIMTEEAFFCHVKSYLKQLLRRPQYAQPDEFLKANGLDGKTLLSHLVDNDIVIKKTKIESSGDKDRFIISYKIPRENFEGKMLKLYSELFENNVNENTITEDGCSGMGIAGATTCDGSSGAFVQPTFPMMRRGLKTESEDINEEAVMNTAIGDFGYDAPPFKKKKKDPAYDHKNMMKKSFRRK
jgi:hypothetical protein